MQYVLYIDRAVQSRRREMRRRRWAVVAASILWVWARIYRPTRTLGGHFVKMCFVFENIYSFMLVQNIFLSFCFFDTAEIDSQIEEWK
jgi:hypothetical protein